MQTTRAPCRALLRSAALFALCLPLHGALSASGGVRPLPADALPLPFHYDLHTFRGRGGRTAVVAAFAVPAGRLQQEPARRGVRYRFDVSLVLADTARRTISRTDDSVLVSFARAPREEHLLFTQIEVQAAPSATTVQRVIMTDASRPGIGQLYGTAFPIPDYSGRELMLSDLALGLPDAGGGWRRGPHVIALLPTSRMPASAFEIYYEIYNLPRDRPYTTDIAVEPAHEHGSAPHDVRSPVHLRFNGNAEAAADGTVTELRRLETSLERGCYRITVTITDDVTGRTATRTRHFDVRGWGPGTTLVPALHRGGR